MIHFRTLLICLFLALIHSAAAGQLTLQIYGLPGTTPENSSVFVAGNFNGWNPGDQAYRFQREAGGLFQLTLPITAPFDLEFKLTQGSWQSVEGDPAGAFLPNRRYSYSGGLDTLRMKIESWELLDPNPRSTAGPNVKVVSTDFRMPQLGRQRRIWICLPSNYESSSQRYPVLYMNDAQNLFDAAASFSGEWKVDETVAQWSGRGFIVVGIENGGENRIDEYSPWPHPKYGGGQGDEYAAFLVQTLKPFIDKNYRTLKSRRNTGIMGSSMGGLIALYTAVEYQNTFGFAGVFSPSLWFSDQWAGHVQYKGKKRPVLFYLLAGVNESETMAKDVWLLAKTLQEAGFPSSSIAVDIDGDGAHSEWFWAREFPLAVDWWLNR